MVIQTSSAHAMEYIENVRLLFYQQLFYALVVDSNKNIPTILKLLFISTGRFMKNINRSQVI